MFEFIKITIAAIAYLYLFLLICAIGSDAGQRGFIGISCAMVLASPALLCLPYLAGYHVNRLISR